MAETGFTLVDSATTTLWDELSAELSNRQRAANECRAQLVDLEARAQKAAKDRDPNEMALASTLLPRAAEAHQAAAGRVADIVRVIARAFHPRAVDHLAWMGRASLRTVRDMALLQDGGSSQEIAPSFVYNGPNVFEVQGRGATTPWWQRKADRWSPLQMLSATGLHLCIPPALPGTPLSGGHSSSLDRLLQPSPRLCVLTSTGETYIGIDPDHEAISGSKHLTPALGRRLARYCPLDLSISRGTRGPKWRIISATIGPRIAACVTAGGQIVAVPVAAIDGVADTASASVARSLKRNQQAQQAASPSSSSPAASHASSSASTSHRQHVASPSVAATASRSTTGPRSAGTMVLVHGVADGFVKQVMLAVPRPAPAASPSASSSAGTQRSATEQRSGLAEQLASPPQGSGSPYLAVAKCCWFVALLANGSLSAFSEQASRVALQQRARPAHSASRAGTGAAPAQARVYQSRYTASSLPKHGEQGRIVSFACCAGAVWGVDHHGMLWRWAVPLSSFSAGWKIPQRTLVVAHRPGGGGRAVPAVSRPRAPSSVPALEGGSDQSDDAAIGVEGKRNAFAKRVVAAKSAQPVPPELQGDVLKGSQPLEAVYAAPWAAWSWEKQKQLSSSKSAATSAQAASSARAAGDHDHYYSNPSDLMADGLVLLKKAPRGRGQLFVTLLGSAAAPEALPLDEPSPSVEHLEGDVWVMGATKADPIEPPAAAKTTDDHLTHQTSQDSSVDGEWDMIPEASSTSQEDSQQVTVEEAAPESDSPVLSPPQSTLAALCTTLDASSATTRFRMAAAGWGCVTAVTQCGEAWVWDWPEPVQQDGRESMSAHDVMAAAIEASTGQALQPSDGCRFDSASIIPPRGGFGRLAERAKKDGAATPAPLAVSPPPSAPLASASPVTPQRVRPDHHSRTDSGSLEEEVSPCARLVLLQRPRVMGMSDEEASSGAGAEGAGLGLASATNTAAADSLAMDQTDDLKAHDDLAGSDSTATAGSAGSAAKPSSSSPVTGPSPAEADAQWARFVRAVRKLVHDRGTAWLAAERSLINDMRRRASSGQDVRLVRPRPPDLWSLITEDEAARLLSDARKRMLNAPLTQRRRQQVWPLLLRLQARILQCSRAATGMDSGREGEEEATGGYGGDIDLRPHVISALLEEASDAIKHAHNARRARSGDSDVRPEEAALQVLWRSERGGGGGGGGGGSPVRGTSRRMTTQTDATNGGRVHPVGTITGAGDAGARKGWRTATAALPDVVQASEESKSRGEVGRSRAQTAGAVEGGLSAASGLCAGLVIRKVDEADCDSRASLTQASDSDDEGEPASAILAAADDGRLNDSAVTHSISDDTAKPKASSLSTKQQKRADTEAGYTDNFAADAAKMVRAARRRRRSTGPDSSTDAASTSRDGEDPTTELAGAAGVGTVLLRSLTTGNLFDSVASGTADGFAPVHVPSSQSSPALGGSNSNITLVGRSVSNRSDALSPEEDAAADDDSHDADEADGSADRENEAAAVHAAAVEAKRLKARQTLHRSLGVLASDMVRTFPATGLFHCPGAPLFERVKQAVLAHTLWDERTGYIQGLTYLAAVLALHAGPDPADDFAARAEALVLGSGMEMVENELDAADEYMGADAGSTDATGSDQSSAHPAPLSGSGRGLGASALGGAPARAVPRQDSATAVTFRMLAILTRQPMLLRLLRVEGAAIGSYSEAMDTALAHSDSALSARLQDASITADLFLYGWAQPLLVRSLPLRSVVRIWDGFLCYGTHFVYISALLVLRLLRPVLMRGDDDDCMAIVTGGCLSTGVAGRAWSAITDEALADALKKPAILDRTIVQLSELEAHMPRVIPNVPKTAKHRNRPRTSAQATAASSSSVPAAAGEDLQPAMTATQQAQAGVLGGLL